MQTIVKFLLAIAALAQAQQLRGSMPAQSNPGAQPGTGYYWPRYPYTNDDIRKDSERTLQNNYVCKWDVTLDGIGQGTNQGILYLPPCTWITPHWHPTTYELNFVLQGQVDYTVFPFGTNPNTTEGGSDNAALKPKEPLKGSVPAGNLFMSPQGVAHLLVNNQCDGLAMMHSFPTSTTEDFFSMWADTQTMPKDYLQDVFGAEPPSDFSELYKLRIPDGIHTVSQQCMARCGITQDFYKNFKCPASLPLKHTVLEMPTPNTTVSINSTEHELGSVTRGHMQRAIAVARHATRSAVRFSRMSSTASPELIKEMAPYGSLRVAINMRNPLLVSGKTDSGDPIGLAPSMGALMAESLGVPVQYVPYENAGKLAEDAGEDNWDVGLIGADPLRATHVEFTKPYVQIEATYAVPESSAYQSFAELDQKGKRIVGCAGTAYVAWLQRNLKNAELTHVEGHDETYQAFQAGGYDALAGLRSKLTKDEAKRPGTKLMDGALMAVEQAAATKKVRSDGCKWLYAFIEEAKTSGQVMEFMKKFGVTGELSIPK